MELRVIQRGIGQKSADVPVGAAGTSLRLSLGVAGAPRRVGVETLDRGAAVVGRERSE